MRKKAQSEAITVVLIILLVLAAVTIVYQAVRGTVTKSTTQLTQKSECLGITMNVIKVTRADTTLGQPNYNSINVTIERGADSLIIDSVKIVVIKLDGTEYGSVTDNTPVTSLGQETVTLTPNAGNALATGTYTVNVAPKISGQQCDSVGSGTLTI